MRALDTLGEVQTAIAGGFGRLLWLVCMAQGPAFDRWIAASAAASRLPPRARWSGSMLNVLHDRLVRTVHHRL